ncbi:MAG TPA: FecR domain-containing protein, partial [Planctomycetota bacterium]|nr:FecR domain-containing protein [Planctomycetota bacterium]
KTLTLTHGTMQVEVQPQTPNHPLRIRIPQAQVVVVGTVITLHADAERTRLAVDHGVVRLRSDSRGERAVGAGQSVTADRFGLRAPGQPVFAWEAGRSDNPTPVLGKLTTAPDGRACLKALQDQETTQVVAVTFDTPGAWCAYDPRTVVTCRVWLGSTVKWAGFYVQDYVHHHHGQWHVPLDQRETWRDVRFTLGELEGAATPAPTMGDVLHIVMLQAQFAPNAELFVDRITITPPDSPAP